jgi:hypothetical protein
MRDHGAMDVEQTEAEVAERAREPRVVEMPAHPGAPKTDRT